MFNYNPEDKTETVQSGLGAAFLQALNEADPSIYADGAPSAPAPVAPAPSAVPIAAPAVAPIVAPPPMLPVPAVEAPAVPAPENIPEVLRQVQELTSLLGSSTPEAAEDFLVKLAEVNEPLAIQLTTLVKQHIESGPAQSAAVELPPTNFDFEAINPDEYDDQVLAEFQAANDDIQAARNAATLAKQAAEAAQAEAAALRQQLAQTTPQSSETFIDGRAKTIQAALAAIPALANDEAGYKLVHNAVVQELNSVPEFFKGNDAFKQGNQLAAYQSGLLVDEAINKFVAQAASKIGAPAPAPAAPAPIPQPPSGAPAMTTAMPAPTVQANQSLVDGLLADLQNAELSGASW